MTARRRTLEASAAQERVIAALLVTGEAHVAGRLQRCMDAMTTRRHVAGWPWTCRSAGCAWCGTSLAHRWWAGLRRWIDHDGAPVSLAVLPLRRRPGDLRAAVARLRRACRDVRDRTARRNRRWREVAVAGMAAGDGTALLLIRHEGISRAEVGEVLRGRWPVAPIGDVGAVPPSWTFAVEDAAELARARRGVEPLRIVVLAQRAANTGERRRTDTDNLAEPFAPMPVTF